MKMEPNVSPLRIHGIEHCPDKFYQNLSILSIYCLIATTITITNGPVVKKVRGRQQFSVFCELVSSYSKYTGVTVFRKATGKLR